jgi:cephalosporin hydroxylase
MSLRRLLGRAAEKSPSPAPADRVVADFHRLYYDSQVWTETYWLGVHAFKCPLDLWVYQELVHEGRPDVIVETGTMNGGSALYLASICDLLDRGRVITVDIDHRADRPRHPRITYLEGRSSTDPGVLQEIGAAIGPGEKVMVILDSDHSRDHVLAELRAYGDLVSSGLYLVVEDSNVNGHPVVPEFGPGPYEAITEFLAGEPGFSVDRSREKFRMTFNPRGYLKKL